MKLNDLRKWLVDNNVPEHEYVINELGGGESDGVGFIDNSWCTYYSQRGHYENIKKYESEDAACRAFAEWIRYLMKGQYSIEIPPPT